MICPNCDSGNIISIGDHSHNIFLCGDCNTHWFTPPEEIKHACAESDADYIYRKKSDIVIIVCKKCGKIFTYKLEGKNGKGIKRT